MTALDYLVSFNDFCGGLPSRDRKGQLVSRSELRRWLQAGALKIDGKVVAWDEELHPPFTSVRLHRSTLV